MRVDEIVQLMNSVQGRLSLALLVILLGLLQLWVFSQAQKPKSGDIQQ